MNVPLEGKEILNLQIDSKLAAKVLNKYNLFGDICHLVVTRLKNDEESFVIVSFYLHKY